MVYLGPVTTLSPSATNKLRAGYSPEHDMPVSKQVTDTQPVAPISERRRGDRRRQQRTPMMEMRSGDRRRRGRGKIDVKV